MILRRVWCHPSGSPPRWIANLVQIVQEAFQTLAATSPPKGAPFYNVWICLQSVRLDEVPVLLLVLWKILMPLASWLPRACVPMWLRSRLTGIARVRSTRLIGLARLATVGIFRIVSLRPNGHREILQFFPNQTQFVDDLFSYLVFHMDPCTFYIVRGNNSFSRHGF